jgi:hypothetical protein
VPGAAGAPDVGHGGRYPRSIEPIKQISTRRGHFGWGGVEVGMTFHETELALGRRLPALGSGSAGVSEDELCNDYSLETALMRQSLRLEFDGKGGEGRLKAIWLPLFDRAGALSTPEIVRALRERFPELRYVPSPHAPDLAESANPRPLFQVPGVDGMIFVDPAQGLYFGEICMD